MGASKKWIKAVLGLQKTNRLPSSEQDENSSGSTDNIWHQRRHSDENASHIIEEWDSNVVTENEGANEASFHTVHQSDEFDTGVLENKSGLGVMTEVEDAQDDSFLSMKHSGEIDCRILENKSDSNAFEDVKDSQSVTNLFSSRLLDTNNANDASLLSVLNLVSLPSTSLEDQKDAQPQQKAREEWAATCIQAAFRRYLARRALRATRGLVRLQALITGRAVKKQAAITLHSMQDLVKVQARVRAKRVRMGLENQIAQQKLQPHFEKEAPVEEAPIKEIPIKETEGGWCSGIGSAEEIRAKNLKRKEAAAKRQKAMAYALARQWQASSRRRVKPSSPGQEKIYWSWNWLDSWLSSSQWENRAVDINLEDGTTKPSGNEADTSRSTSAGKKPATDVGNRKMVRCPSTRSDITYKEKCVSSPIKAVNMKETLSPRTPTRSPRHSLKHSREELSLSRLGPQSHSTPKERSLLGDLSSPIKAGNMKETLSPRTPTRSPRPSLKDSREELSLSRLGPRSRSTPKERSPLGDNPVKKRLSLPTTEQVAKQQVSRVGVKRTMKTTTSTSYGNDSNLSPRTV